MNKLGLIAGEGKFPILIAKEAASKGIEVFVICAKGNSKEEDFNSYAVKIITLKLGQLGKALKFFKENSVSKAVMAGRVEHFNIFNLIPDLRTAKVQRALRVAVLRAPDDVVGGQQHLSHRALIPGERFRVGVREGLLPDAGRRLLGRQVARTAAQPQRSHPGGDGAGRHQNHLSPVVHPGRHGVHQSRQQRVVQRALGRGERGRADLHHQPVRCPDRLAGRRQLHLVGHRSSSSSSPT